ncbi:maleylpyruvate isomerase N-terminal domain-containing protein [Streptomyces sp. NPDC016566]
MPNWTVAQQIAHLARTDRVALLAVTALSRPPSPTPTRAAGSRS